MIDILINFLSGFQW